MRIIIFGTIIRTRKSLGRLIKEAIKNDGLNKNPAWITWALNIYNSGIFGLVFYKTKQKSININHFK